MKKIILVLGILIFSFFFLPGCSKKSEQKPALDESQIEEALAVGRKGKDISIFEFQKEWNSNLGYGVASALLQTPFYRLSLLARNAAMRGVNFPPSLIKNVLQENSGIFHFVVTIYGSMSEPGFARDAIASLKHNGKTIKPILSINDQYADVNREQTNVAICEYEFSSTNINRGAKITLSVTIPKMEGEKEDHILSFPFNLSKIR